MKKITYESNNNFENIRQEYPKILTLDQMRIICKIAKRSAKYLLDQGIVPCENTGKKTRQYKIRRDDVITYLQKRSQWSAPIPRIPSHLQKNRMLIPFPYISAQV